MLSNNGINNIQIGWQFQEVIKTTSVKPSGTVSLLAGATIDFTLSRIKILHKKNKVIKTFRIIRTIRKSWI